ncbi:hypothetical protein DH2020_045341 [Rehmannia glutinosa]|uniref:GRF-type domain-containing protein n=1 Tax=Rehmannia glutinosa TaxID=99300 RepID=A0ABR0UED7_REHGL
MHTSWTNDNPGRRFVCCVNSLNGNGCGFFEWADNPMCARTKAIIRGMLQKINNSKAEIGDLESRVKNVKKMEEEIGRLKMRTKGTRFATFDSCGTMNATKINYGTKNAKYGTTGARGHIRLGLIMESQAVYSTDNEVYTLRERGADLGKEQKRDIVYWTGHDHLANLEDQRKIEEAKRRMAAERVYELEELNGKKLHRAWNVSNLKKYYA